MTLDEATKKFEAVFGRVVPFDSMQEKPARAPNGQLYQSYYGGCAVAEAAPIDLAAFSATEQEAIDRFHDVHCIMPDGDRRHTLYWRCKPQLEKHPKYGWTVYSRYTVGRTVDSGTAPK